MTQTEPATSAQPGPGAAVPVNFRELSWQDRLAHVVETMREMSLQTDPQQVVTTFARRMRGTIEPGHTISLSRRGLSAPRVRVTRNSQWQTQPDPWRETHLLPVLGGGLLSDLVYGEKAVILPGLSLAPDDPSRPYLEHAKSLMAIPHFEDGVGLNMVVHTAFRENGFKPESLPELVLSSNLFGRATKNLVLSRDLREAYNALDAELRSVQAMQLALLPQGPPRIATLDVATHYQTSTRAGGDSYDFFKPPDGRWGLMVADVSGHGTPAAVLMAVVHALSHMMPGEPWPPGTVLSYLNRALCERYTLASGAFVTMLYGVYDERTRVLRFASAGHPAPLVRGVNGDVREVEAVGAGLPLGITPDEVYGERDVTLEPGQVLVMYTDGITEAFNGERRMFGDQRLRDAIRDAGRDANDVVNTIVARVGEFAGLTSRNDDRTIVAAGVR